MYEEGLTINSVAAWILNIYCWYQRRCCSDILWIENVGWSNQCDESVWLYGKTHRTVGSTRIVRSKEGGILLEVWGRTLNCDATLLLCSYCRHKRVQRGKTTLVKFKWIKLLDKQMSTVTVEECCCYAAVLVIPWRCFLEVLARRKKRRVVLLIVIHDRYVLCNQVIRVVPLQNVAQNV